MSGARTHHLLVDGALWHDRPPLSGLDLERHGRALYEDLGDAAARVGPWLLPWPADLDQASVPLPTRLGLSQLEVEVSPEADRKSTRLNSSHSQQSRMPSSA